mmetsp:Transcript_85783/g.188336  ORF Transcript_85783/g.188336 Transcript_85783/m.188336 type:complete len:454 (-) Transcript_85783:298-1659(-)
MRRRGWKSFRKTPIRTPVAVQEVDEEYLEEDELEDDVEVESDDELRPLNPAAEDILQDPNRPSFWRLLTGEPWPEQARGEEESERDSSNPAGDNSPAKEKDEKRRIAQEKKKRLEALAVGFRKAEKGEELTPQEVLDLRHRSYVRYMCTQLGAELEDSLNRGWIPENADLQKVLATILAETGEDGGGGGDTKEDASEKDEDESLPKIPSNPAPAVHRRWKGSENPDEEGGDGGDSSNSNSTSSSNIKGGSPGGASLRNRKDNAAKKSKSKTAMLEAKLKQYESDLEERRKQKEAFLKSNFDSKYNAKIHQKAWALAGRQDLWKKRRFDGKFKDSDDEDEGREDSDEDVADWDEFEEEAVGNLIDSMKGDPPTDLWGMDGWVLFIFFFVVIAGSVFTFMYLALYARNYPGWFHAVPEESVLAQATSGSDVIATFSTVKKVSKHAKHLKKIGSLR